MMDEVVASASAGCFATILGHPLDCVKVRLQASATASAPGTATVAYRMLRTEGVATFWRGLGPPLMNAVAMNTAMWR